jgi:hypothetical protein
MIFSNKKFLSLRVFIFSFFIIIMCSCHSNRPGYNPYLRKRPLEKQYKSNKRAVDRGTKNYHKQMKKNRRFLGIGRPADKPMGN